MVTGSIFKIKRGQLGKTIGDSDNDDNPLLLIGGKFLHFQTGCRGASSNKPLATNCNACRYVKNADTGECLKECPAEGWTKLNDKTCKSKIYVARHLISYIKTRIWRLLLSFFFGLTKAGGGGVYRWGGGLNRGRRLVKAFQVEVLCLL